MAQTTPAILLASLLLLPGCAGGKSGVADVGGGPVDPPTGPTAFSFQASLSSATPGPGTIRIDFTPPADSGYEPAVFLSTSRNDLFTTSPQLPAPSAPSLQVTGLSDGTQYFLGLGIRLSGTSDPFVATGAILTATPGSPLYVDAASSAANPDGLTPQTAFSDVISGVLTAFVLGGAENVWIAAGDYPVANIPLFAGVHVYGGFGRDFDLATRDPEGTPTVWRVLPGQKCIEIGGGNPTAILDGLRIDGGRVGRTGVDINESSLELRRVVITDLVDRGIRVRNLRSDVSYDVVITSCQSSRNGIEGLLGNGPFDYTIFNSVFAANVQEGIDIKQLEPETGGTTTLRIESSRFFGNGAEGLDATLTLPLSPTQGAYEVRIRGCAFERNTLTGCLIDEDFETVPDYFADITVRESFSRANDGYGFHLDLDALDRAFLFGLLASDNGLDGLYLSSESEPGLVLLSSSALIGNAGAGLRAEGPPTLPGNRAVAVSHCLFAGNFTAGMISRDIQATAVSSIAYRQANPFQGTTLVGTVSSADPLAMGFVNAPEEYLRVLSSSGATLTLATTPDFGTAATLELADDALARAPASIAGSVVMLTEAPEDFAAPGLLTAFAPGTKDVVEDYRLLPGSIAAGAGMAPSGGPAVDAGIFGAPVSAPPGFAEPVAANLFRPTATSPAVSQGVGALDPITVTFSADLEPASADASSVRAVRGTTQLGITFFTSARELVISPPPGGWGSGSFLLELDRGLRNLDGNGTAAPIALSFSVR